MKKHKKGKFCRRGKKVIVYNLIVRLDNITFVGFPSYIIHLLVGGLNLAQRNISSPDKFQPQIFLKVRKTQLRRKTILESCLINWKVSIWSPSFDTLRRRTVEQWKLWLENLIEIYLSVGLIDWIHLLIFLMIDLPCVPLGTQH